jgi:hypothetical protein
MEGDKNMDLQIKNIPSIQEIEFKTREISDSHKLNQTQEQVFNDILDLFNKANTLQKEMYEMNVAANIESTCYAKRLEETLTRLSLIEEQYNNLLLAPEDFRTITRYALDATVDELSPFSAVIDTNTNDIIANIISSVSKTRMYDETYDETLIPPSLKIYVGPDSFNTDNEHILTIEDSDISNALDGNISTVWFRRIVTDTSIESIENEVVIGLPEDIITSRMVNQIILSPYPSGYVDIMNIEYKTNGAWQTIPGLEYHNCYSEEEYEDIFGNKYTRGVIKNAPNIKLNFKPIQTNQIRVKLRQRNYEYDAQNNRRVWYLGIRDLDVNYNRYTKDHSEFDMVFDFLETDKNIKVYDTEIFCNNNIDSAILENVYKEYYYYDADGNTHKVSDSLPFILNGHKLMVRFTIEGTTDTPNINKCSVKYKLS